MLGWTILCFMKRSRTENVNTKQRRSCSVVFKKIFNALPDKNMLYIILFNNPAHYTVKRLCVMWCCLYCMGVAHTHPSLQPPHTYFASYYIKGMLIFTLASMLAFEVNHELGDLKYKHKPNCWRILNWVSWESGYYVDPRWPRSSLNYMCVYHDMHATETWVSFNFSI